MSSTAHGDEHAKQIQPDGDIGEPAKLLQGSNLTDQETDNGPNQTANDITEFELDSLGKGLPRTHDNQADIKQQLDSLQDVEEIAHVEAVDTEAQITEASNGEVV